MAERTISQLQPIGAVTGATLLEGENTNVDFGRLTVQDIIDLVSVPPTQWGTIGGTLSDQLDLQAALDAKADDSDLANYLPLTGGTLSNTLIIDGPTFNTHLRLTRAGTESWDISPSTNGSLIFTDNLPSGTNAVEIQASLTATQNINASGQVRSNTATPVGASDLTRKDYVDTNLAAKADQSTTYTKAEVDALLAGKLDTTGGTITGTLTVTGNIVSNADVQAFQP